MWRTSLFHRITHMVGLSSFVTRASFMLLAVVGVKVVPFLHEDRLLEGAGGTTVCVILTAPSKSQTPNPYEVVIIDTRPDAVGVFPLPSGAGCTTDKRGNLVVSVYLDPGKGEYLTVAGEGPLSVEVQDSRLYPGHHYGLRVGDDLPRRVRIRTPKPNE